MLFDENKIDSRLSLLVSVTNNRSESLWSAFLAGKRLECERETPGSSAMDLPDSRIELCEEKANRGNARSIPNAESCIHVDNESMNMPNRY